MNRSKVHSKQHRTVRHSLSVSVALKHTTCPHNAAIPWIWDIECQVVCVYTQLSLVLNMPIHTRRARQSRPGLID